MTPNSISYWKRLWRWTTSMSLTEEDLLAVLGSKEVKEELKLGLGAYKPLKANDFKELQSKNPDQTKLTGIVQNLQQYIDVDCFQIWDVIKHYLCDISYGTPESALKNTAFVDTRPVFLLPNIWKFYYRERLFLLKLIQHIIEFHDDPNYKYKDAFNKIVTDIGLQNLKTSLIDQFDKLLSTAPPPKKIQNDLSSDTILVEWAKSNLREQLAILQTLILIADKVHILPEEFLRLLDLFRKHGFGKKQGFANLLDERDREACYNIMHVELCLFLVLTDGDKKKCVTTFMEAAGARAEAALASLRTSEEHAVMLLAWMMLSLQSDKYSRMFESHYQHFGTTALKMKVFEFLQQVVASAVISDESRCASISRAAIFDLLCRVCDAFDGDGTVGRQPGAVALCGALLAERAVAGRFWARCAAGGGAGSLWCTALERFPHDYSALAVIAGGLARGGRESVERLLVELDSLPVYTEVYNPNAVPIISLDGEEATIGRDHYPLGGPAYRVAAGSTATIMEHKEATLIHYRTPYSYWTIFNDEVEKALDRKRHHQFNVEDTLQRVYAGTQLLAEILSALPPHEIPAALLAPSEAACGALLGPAPAPPPLAAAGLRVCAALARAHPLQIHSRLINTGLLPRLLTPAAAGAAAAALATGAALEAGAVGAWLPAERPAGDYRVLAAYLDLLMAFHESCADAKVTHDIVLPGVVLLLREVFPSAQTARYSGAARRRAVLRRCVALLAAAAQAPPRAGGEGGAADTLRRVCVYGVLHTENAVELLKIVRVGNDELEDTMAAETNWVSGAAQEYVCTLQRALATLMLALRHKRLVTPAGELTPLERLIFAQSHKTLKVVPRVTSYINNAFSKHLAVLGCCLLKRFAETFQMSLFASLDMTSYQVRVMFLARLRDAHESLDLKVAILEFVATCVGKQPGLTEAFFKLNHMKVDADTKVKEGDTKVTAKVKAEEEEEDSFDGILGYMADYLGSVKEDSALLHSPLLACVMTLFHALWRNNMQVLVRELRDNPAFWSHLTSPLFAPVQPRLRTYAQIFNVLGIELFTSRENVDANLKEMLEKFFNIDKPHLDTWIEYIYSFAGRDAEEAVDNVPAWLGLLTSWKDFTTIFCKFLPLGLNIAHKAKLVAPCLAKLLAELEDVKDGRLVVILSELYVTMLANWREDCFDDRRANARQMENLLTNAAVVYDCLHPRAKRSILSIGTVAISSLDFEIKANCAIGQNIIRAVTSINSYELEKLFDCFQKETDAPAAADDEETPPIVISLALLEQCLELYDDMFSGLAQWFQTTRFTNKLLCCLQLSLQRRRHYRTSLAALRCLTAYARGPFSKDLLLSDIDQFLWLALLPPQFEAGGWRMEEWWQVYGSALDFIALMVTRHGEFFASDAVTFVGVHLEHLVEAILAPRHSASAPALALSGAALHLAVRLLRYEPRWRLENVHSLETIMAAISANLQQCVMLMLRLRRSADAPAADPAAPAAAAAAAAHTALLQKTLELLHVSTVALIAHSPPLLTLLAAAAAPAPARAALDFTAPAPGATRLTFGTLLCAVCVRARSLNHTYAAEEASGARRRRGASASPRGARSESNTSVSSCASAALPAPAPQPHALEAALTLLAQQALLAIRDPNVPTRHKQLIRRELSSELAIFHDFVRKRVLGAAAQRPLLDRNKLGAWPLAADEREVKLLEQYAREREPEPAAEPGGELPPPPPPKRASTDSMREYILRKRYLTKCAQTPLKEPPSPVSHSTPTSDRKKEAARSSKRVSWAETTRGDADPSDHSDLSLQDDTYSTLTDVQIGDEDYFHFMSVVFLWICQMEL